MTKISCTNKVYSSRERGEKREKYAVRGEKRETLSKSDREREREGERERERDAVKERKNFCELWYSVGDTN